MYSCKTNESLTTCFIVLLRTKHDRHVLQENYQSGNCATGVNRRDFLHAVKNQFFKGRLAFFPKGRPLILFIIFSQHLLSDCSILAKSNRICPGEMWNLSNVSSVFTAVFDWVLSDFYHCSHLSVLFHTLDESFRFLKNLERRCKSCLYRQFCFQSKYVSESAETNKERGIFLL